MTRLDAQGRGATVPRLALSLDEAAEALGISRDHFDANVRPRLRQVQVGRRVLVAVAELERYLEAAAS